MVESYPPEFLAFFGGDVATLATPEGFLGMYGFSMLPVIVGIFAVLAGSGLWIEGRLIQHKWKTGENNGRASVEVEADSIAVIARPEGSGQCRPDSQKKS